MKNMDDMTVVEGLETGLKQALAYAKGDKTKARSSIVDHAGISKPPNIRYKGKIKAVSKGRLLAGPERE